MKFNEVLDTIISSHSVRSIDICNELGIKKSYLSRIRSGSLIPPDFGLIDDIAKMLDVSPEEYRRLAYTYQEIKADKKYQTAYKAFNKLYGFDPKCIHYTVDVKKKLSLTNGQGIYSSNEVRDAILDIIGSGSKLCFFYSPKGSELTEHIAAKITASAVEVEWLILLEKTNGISNTNIEILSDSLPLIFAGGVHIKSVYFDIKEVLELFNFPFYIASEDELLMFNVKADSAIYFNSSETVNKFRERFSSRFSDAVSFISAEKDISGFFTHYEDTMHFSQTAKGTEFYIIEKNPCILFEVNTSDVTEYIRDIEDAREIALKYMVFLQKSSNNVDITYNLFSSEGLGEIVNNNIYYEISPKLTKPIPKEFRCGALSKLVDFANFEEKFQPLIIRLPIFDKTYVSTVNLWSDGKMIVFYSTDTSTEILMVNEKSIVTAFIDYYRTLIKSGLIKSKAETLIDIRKALDDSDYKGLSQAEQE